MGKVRCWIPWSLLVVLTVVAVTSAVIGSATSRGEPVQRGLVDRSPAPGSTPSNVGSHVVADLPPQAGFRGQEKFCAVPPLTGTIQYDGTSGTLTGVLAVSVGGLPPDDEVFVNWSNDHVRAPVIATFGTDGVGISIQSSVQVGRLGEVRGVEVDLSGASVPNPVLGRLEPC
jgi:hypothetical protein